MLLSSSSFAQPARPFRETVTIAVDSQAAKTLQILEDRWATGRWEELVETLIELQEARGQSTIAIEAGAAGQTARYGLVGAECDRLVASLPPEGLAIYRRRIDPAAERWFHEAQESGDIAPLERLVQQAYYSSWGDDALWELGQLAWDRGDFLAARNWWSQLLPDDGRGKHYPDSDQVAADVAARLILCDVFHGNRESASEELRAFETEYGDAPGRLGGRDGPWRELIADVIEQSSARPQPAMTTDVPTLGGTIARTMVSPRTVDVGSELWSVPLTPQRLPEVPRATLFPPAPPTAFHPAVVGSRVFLNDGNHIFAWDLASGRPAWGEPEARLSEKPGFHTASAVIYPAVEQELSATPARPVSGGPCWSVTVQDGRLFARMGSAITTPAPQELRDLPNEIVCLDVAGGQGRLLWKLTGEEFTASLPDAGEGAPWGWEGTPLAADGRVYAALSRRRPQLEWSVACLDAETGLLLWHRPVGVSRPSPPEYENRASQLLLTLGDGRLYLSTEWGAIVALDAAEGRLQWAVTYESQPVMASAARSAIRAAPSPCVLAEGRVFAAPSDSNRVFCLDGATGETVWQRIIPERMSALLGVAQSRLILASNSLWALHAETGQLQWQVLQADPDDYGYGRGWLAGDRIYWTARQTLFVVDQHTGQVLREQPLGTLDQPRTGGNVVVNEGVLLIAGADRLTAYGRFAKPLPPKPEPLTLRPRRLPKSSETSEVLSHVSARRIAFQANGDEPPVDNVGPGYWKRVWRRPLASGERVLLTDGDVPSSQESVVLCQGPQLQGWDRSTGQLRWELPLDHPVIWSARSDAGLMVATAEELCGIQPDVGRVVWRLAWRAELLSAAPQQATASDLKAAFHLLPRGVLIVAHQLGWLWCDADTGDVMFQRTLIEPFRSAVSPATNQLLLQSRTSSATQLWDLCDPTPRRVETAGKRIRFDAAHHQPGGWVALADNSRLAWLSPTLEHEREYVGTISQAHTAPCVIHAGENSALIVDGVTLVGLRLDDGRRVWPKWSQPLTRVPLLHPREQTAVDGDCIYAAAGGLLRARLLATGETVWERPLSLSDPMQVVAANDTVVALPFRSSAAPLSSVTFFDAASGRPVQSIALSPAAKEISLHLDAAGAVVVTDREVIGLEVR